MFDHISIAVSDVARSRIFYDSVLTQLGYVRSWSTADAAGYGLAGRDEAFAIRQAPPGEHIAPSASSHIAFSAPSRDAVAAFHAAAMTHGAADEGAPGIHAEYGPTYFAAFVRDPDGYRLEAVLHESGAPAP